MLKYEASGDVTSGLSDRNDGEWSGTGVETTFLSWVASGREDPGAAISHDEGPRAVELGSSGRAGRSG